MKQASRDLGEARLSYDGGYYEWACSAAQQAAEKVLKGLIYALGGSVRGHVVAEMLKKLPEDVEVPRDVLLAGSRLDKYYTTARYPNGFDAGAPGEHFLEEEAARAIILAEKIAEFCRSRIPG